MNPHDNQASRVLDGAKKCIDNAASIFMDATILQDGGRHIRAFTLYHIATEEARKGLSLITGYLFGRFDTQEQVLKYLAKGGKGRSHLMKIKGGISMIVPLLIMTRENGDDIWPLVDYLIKESENAPEYVRDKERSLYVEFDGASFTVPEDAITPERCDKMKSIANVAILFADSFHKAGVIKPADLRKMAMNLDEKKATEEARARIAAMRNNPEVTWDEGAQGYWK